MSQKCHKCNEPLVQTANFCTRCGASVNVPLDDGQTDSYVGQTIAGNFEILERIGVGSMGVVYLAEQISLKKKVAIKILKASMAQNQEVLQRFQREARAASRLNHPNSILVTDFGQGEDGAPFIAMEYIDGRDLGQLLSDEFPLDPERVLRFLIQVCSALDEAHAAGIIHRDLKPANIVVSKRRSGEEFVKVLDFGIAKINDPDANTGQHLTQEGLVCGTPAFMSPEQVKGLPLDPRSDIYALGVVLFMLLTGRLPFQASSSAAMAAKIITESPPRVSKVRLDLNVPAIFDPIVSRAMAKDREERYESAIALRKDLEDALIRLQNPARALAPASAPEPEPVPVPVGAGPSGSIRALAPAPTGTPRYAAPPGSAPAPPPKAAPAPEPPRAPAPPETPTHAHRRPPNTGAHPALKGRPRPDANARPVDAVMATSIMAEGAAPAAAPTRAAEPDEPVRISRGAGFWMALLVVILAVAASAAGAYWYIVIYPQTAEADPTTREAETLTVVTPKAVELAVGKARYHVNLAIIQGEPGGADKAAPDPKTDNVPTEERRPGDRKDKDKDKDRDKDKGRDKDKDRKDPANAANPDDTPEPGGEDEPPAAASRGDRAKEEYEQGMKVMASDSQDALRHFEKAAQLNPRYRDAWVQIQRIAVRVGDDGKARKACLRVIALSRADDFAKSSCERWLKQNGGL